ncbi:MAG: MlaA family lipoprotein [Luteolibacter sp.]
MKIRLGAASALLGVFVGSCAPGPHAGSQSSPLPQTAGREAPDNYPEVIADPFEPVNRGIGIANSGLILGIIRPTSYIYRSIVPSPARKSVGNFAHNIAYPGRLLNNILQGQWRGAGDETVRFITNSTVGLAGLFDPATHLDIPKSDASFSQTFHKWGWQPSSFVVLPLLGPSDDMHSVGLLADKVPEPWNYYSPLSTISGAFTFNELSDQVENVTKFIKTEPDPYAGSKYFWTYSSKDYEPDWETTSPKHPPTLQTLNVANIRSDDPNFALHSHDASVRLSSTGKKVKFNYWLQDKPAPLVFVAPGIGSHRLSSNTLAVAENLHQNGYSVVTTVGIFHPEFMESASTAALPAYPPTDCHDLHIYLTDINRALEEKHPGMFGNKGIVGFSLGAFQTLYLAANQSHADPGLIQFDRYVAINPPVDLRYGDDKLDEFFDASLAWPAEQRQSKINNTLHKAAMLPTLPNEQRANPPIDGIESKYLIGLAFRIVLRDTIFSSQYRHNLGVIQTPLNKWRRDAAYDEILNYSYTDYFNLFALPHYATKGVTCDDFARQTNLRTYGKQLGANPDVRVITNRDDFLLRPSDISWLKSTFGSSRVTLFPSGGHIGNISSSSVEKEILNSLNGL